MGSVYRSKRFMDSDPVDEIQADNSKQVGPALTLQELDIGVRKIERSDKERRKIEIEVEARPPRGLSKRSPGRPVG